MIKAEHGVRQELWSSASWRKLRLDAGRLVETVVVAGENGARREESSKDEL
jgi:hypothetical protein